MTAASELASTGPNPDVFASSCVKTGRPAQTLGEGDRISKRLAGTSGSQLLQSKINRALLNACGLDLPREHATILYEQAF